MYTKIAIEIARDLKTLAIEYNQKTKSDDTWHYYNQICTDCISLTVDRPEFLFSEHLESSNTEETFEEGERFEYSSLSFKYLLTSVDPSADCFKVTRILNSSTYLPVREQWILSESEFVEYLSTLIEKDNSPIGFEFTNTLCSDILEMTAQIENSI